MSQEDIKPNRSLKIALIGQSAFAVDVFHLLRRNGHIIVGIFTVPDKEKREDVLAKAGNENKVPVFKIKSWRKAGKPLEEVLNLYQTVNADLNILAYCTQFIPMEVINYPPLKSICYHPSILPRHRGASSINWTLICGDQKAGLSIFWVDDELDHGPILLQEETDVLEDDTVDSLYKRFLYPIGVLAVAKAANLIANNQASSLVQSEKDATYDALLNKPELQIINFAKTGLEIHNFIRGMDSVPGASCEIKLSENENYQKVYLYGSTIWNDSKPDGKEISILNSQPGLIHEEGLLIRGTDGTYVNVTRVKINGRMRLASKLDQISTKVDVDYNPEENKKIEVLRETWKSILSVDIEESTNFFESGGGSMDVVRLIEEAKEIFKIDLSNEDIFMNPSFDDFCINCVLKIRKGTESEEIIYKPVQVLANNLNLQFPCQLFINGQFVDAENGQTLEIINPTDENVICEVSCGSVNDVDKAVLAAKAAFETGEWSKISARDRSKLLYRLADLMNEHREELATLESIDSGAVYTLALKTHVGMSIESWRYFAGWCDKIQGSTIPISYARPNKNLSFTKKEPIGVCGLITPWNYPLMMLSWKMAPCLAAGNTVIIKPAQVCPLTALKFAELSAKAGFPPGVINVVPGTGSVTGQALASHTQVRKLGFTGSTEIGKIIMKTCAESNLKKVSLELGGKSPLVIFSDCDLNKAVRIGMQSVFFNKGENCIAAGRLFVEEKIHDEFVRRVVTETEKIAIGDPLNKSTAHGPQNHLAHLKKLLSFIETGKQENAKLECGGKRLDRPGYFLEPTVFSNVQDHMYIAKEESFGPIMIISKFKNGDIDGVLKRANATEYGLAAGVFTNDIGKALKFSENVNAGTVFINTYNKTDVAAPFGGFKQSGFGKDLGAEALNEYLKTKCITIEY